MTAPRVLAVGTPPTFRQTVTRAMDGVTDSVVWVPSVTAAEEMIVADGPSEVMVLSPGVKELDALGFSEFVARFAPASAVVLVREHPSAALVTSAMRAGARDIVDLSRGHDELRDALERALEWTGKVRASKAPARVQPGRGAVVAIFSSKGGSGKTFVATSLAVAVAKRWNVDTAVVDLDLDMGDVFAYYGQEPKLAVQDLLALGDRTDRDAILAAGTPIVDHLWAYGAPTDPAMEAPSGEAVGKLLRSIRNQFAFTVVDATAEYSDQALAAFDIADTICLVAALDVVGVRHLAKGLETLQLIGIPRDRIRVVLNRADSQVGLSPAQVEKIMRLHVDAKIPSSRMVPTALNRGRPVYLDEPSSEIARSIDALADLVAAPVLGPGGATPAAGRRRGLFRRRPSRAASTDTPAASNRPAESPAADETPETEPRAPRAPRPVVKTGTRRAAPARGSTNGTTKTNGTRKAAEPASAARRSKR